MAVLLNVRDEAHVLLRRPGALVQPDLGAARCPAFPHLLISSQLAAAATAQRSSSSPQAVIVSASLVLNRIESDTRREMKLQPGHWQVLPYIYTQWRGAGAL